MLRHEELDLVHRLVTGQRVLSLSVLVESKPYVGLLPFVPAGDFGAVVVHASSLARHSRGLTPGAPFAALIHADDRPGADPLQLPRLSLQGTVQRLEPSTPDWDAWRDLYIEKYPTSRSVFQLGDFHLYRLTIESCRLIAGFGSIHTLTRQTLAEAAAADRSAAEPPA